MNSMYRLEYLWIAIIAQFLCKCRPTSALPFLRIKVGGCRSVLTICLSPLNSSKLDFPNALSVPSYWSIEVETLPLSILYLIRIHLSLLWRVALSYIKKKTEGPTGAVNEFMWKHKLFLLYCIFLMITLA